MANSRSMADLPVDALYLVMGMLLLRETSVGAQVNKEFHDLCNETLSNVIDTYAKIAPADLYLEALQKRDLRKLVLEYHRKFHLNFDQIDRLFCLEIYTRAKENSDLRKCILANQAFFGVSHFGIDTLIRIDTPPHLRMSRHRT